MKNIVRDLSAVFKAFIVITILLMINACTVDDTVNPSDTAVSDNLHIAFKTPDGERTINCEQLDLYPSPVNDSISSVSATSQSTLETFFFTYPTDSSGMVKLGKLKKYKIVNVYENEQPFQYSQKLSFDENSPDT
jgi:hypothetical protein